MEGSVEFCKGIVQALLLAVLLHIVPTELVSQGILYALRIHLSEAVNSVLALLDLVESSGLDVMDASEEGGGGEA